MNDDPIINVKADIQKTDIQKQNKSAIYSWLLYHPGQSKQDIVSALNLSLPTVSKNITLLMEAGLICKSGTKKNTGGRTAATYSIVKDARVAIGIDITRNHLAVVLVDLTGAILKSVRHRIPFRPADDYYQYLGATISSIIQSVHIDSSRILGVGIGVPALVDKDRKSIFFSKIINLSGTTMEDFSKYIPYNIKLFNDAKAAVFTETWRNDQPRNIFYLLLSNNVGGAMVIDNKVYMGDNQQSSEVGHITLVPGGKECYCGQLGCVDGYLAATNLSDMTDGNLGQFFVNVSKGLSPYADKWSEYLDYLARTVNIVHVLLDCEIIIGGYIGAYMAPYIDELKRRVSDLSTFSYRTNYLAICSYRQESIAAGAALNFIAEFLETI